MPIHRGLWPVLLMVSLLVWLPAPGIAQERVTVLTEPGTPVVATEILIAVGPADEEEAQAGLAYLSARAVVEPLRPLLDSLEAHIQITPYKDALAFSLTTAPDTWEAVSRALLVALLRDPADSVAVSRERAAIREELLARATNPADALAREVDAAFFGPEHPWGRSTVGSPRTVARLQRSDVSDFLRFHFKPERLFAAVVGPLEAVQVRRVLDEFIEGAGPLPFEPMPQLPLESPVARDYNSITTWVSTSFRFPIGTDEEALRMVAYLTERALAFGPGRASVFNVRSEVLPRLGGGELRFQVVIPPHEADRWADRVQQTIVALTETPMLEADIQAERRRYRGERLRTLSAPEDRAREAARRLLVHGRAGTVVPEVEALSRARIRAAVEALSEPTVVFLGPFLDENER